MYIAFDDTDSTNFMCTTFLATEIIRALPQYDLIGFPRLVRLNPSVPWKTRGNGALCLRLGHGAGQSSIIGEIEGREIKSYSRSKGAPDRDEVLELCHQLLTKWSRTQEDASPGMVVSERQPSQRLYWRTVREIVRKEEVLEELHRVGASFFELAGGRGIIGASAAMSWRPRDRTYEILAYRTRERWGSPREVRPEDVALLDSLFPSTFNNYDSVAQRPVIVPHSPCPILFGIRGDDPSVLPIAMRSIRGEAIDRWLIFITNQGTDDHIIRKWSELRPWSSYCVQGKVSKAPRTIAGGHVILGLSTKVGEVECAAYEPSKEFREVVRKLIAGDEVVVMGELRENPRTLNLEKLCVTELARDWRKVSNPICPQCSKSMKSMGVSGWYRCKRCGQKSKGGEKREEMTRDLVPGWYEPPVRARRHLSMPLKRQLLP
ncbi:MAG: tRNA(Ile)(2)-agmatinylcytidine synthase [Methanomassiliicoccales archaeon]